MPGSSELSRPVGRVPEWHGSGPGGARGRPMLSDRRRGDADGRPRGAVDAPSRRRRDEPADEALLRVVYEEHGRAVLAYATRLVRDRHAAADVVQETFLRAWRHPEVLVRGHGPIRGWLLAVARNIVIDRARAAAIRPQEVADTAIDLGGNGIAAELAAEPDHAERVAGGSGGDQRDGRAIRRPPGGARAPVLGRPQSGRHRRRRSASAWARRNRGLTMRSLRCVRRSREGMGGEGFGGTRFIAAG